MLIVPIFLFLEFPVCSDQLQQILKAVLEKGEVAKKPSMHPLARQPTIPTDGFPVLFLPQPKKNSPRGQVISLKKRRPYH